MYKSVISILVLMSFASCAMDHEIVSKEQERKIITLTSVTKATEGEPTTSPFNSGDVWLWAKTSNNTEYIKAWKLSSDSDGNLTSTSGDKYWPSDGSELTFYALHGNFGNTAITTSWADLSLTHTVETNQSTDADKLKSDLLYAMKGSVSSNTTPAKLTFEHLLAKITVKLDLENSEGITAEELAGATVTLTNILPEATFTSSTGAAASAGGERKTIIAGKPTTVSEGGEIGSAIVPLQSFANENIIQITLSDERIFSYTPDATTLEKSKEYTYTLKIINGVLSVSSITVTNFTDNSVFKSWDIYLGELSVSDITVNGLEQTTADKSWDHYVESSE